LQEFAKQLLLLRQKTISSGKKKQATAGEKKHLTHLSAKSTRLLPKLHTYQKEGINGFYSEVLS
jgi:hypothetical protein